MALLFCAYCKGCRTGPSDFTIRLMPTELIVAIFLTTTLVSTGLLGVWAGTSQLHWFVRFAMVAAVLCPLVWAGGHQAFFMLFFQAILVAAGVRYFGRSWRRSKFSHPAPAHHEYRFSLLTVLLLVVVVAILSAIAARMVASQPSTFFRMAASGLILAVPVNLAWLVAMSVSRRRISLGLLGILVGCAILVVVIWYFIPSQPSAWLTWPASFCLTWMFVSLFSFMAAHDDHRDTNRIAAWIKRPLPIRLVTWALLLTTVSPPMYAFWHLVKPPEFSPQSQTGPNHYNEIVAIGQAIQNASPQQIEIELNRLRQVIAKPTYVPLEFVSDENWLDEQGNIRDLSRAIKKQGDMEIVKQNPDAAAEWYLDCVRFGIVVRCGGLLINGMMGHAITNVGIKPLFEHRQKFSPQQRKIASRQLLALTDEIEPYEEFKRRDRGWMQVVHGLPVRMLLMVEDIAFRTYSVGPNRVDDGGQPPPDDSQQVNQGDFVLGAILLDDTIAP